jgi:hypothetical protein
MTTNNTNNTNNASSTAKPTTAELRALESFVDEAEAQGSLWWQERITAEIREARSYLRQGDWGATIRRAKSAATKEDEFGKGQSTVAARFLAEVKALKQRYEIHGNNGEAAKASLRAELEAAAAESEPAPEPKHEEPKHEEPKHEASMRREKPKNEQRKLTAAECKAIRKKGAIATQSRMLGLKPGYLQGALAGYRLLPAGVIDKVLALDPAEVAAATEADRRAANESRTSGTKAYFEKKKPVEPKSDDGKDRDPKPEKPSLTETIETELMRDGGCAGRWIGDPKPAPTEDRSDEGKNLDPSTNPENPRARIVTVPSIQRLTVPPELRSAAREAMRMQDAEPRETVPLSVQVTEAPLSSMIVRLDGEITKAKLRLEALESLRLDWLLQAAKELA